MSLPEGEQLVVKEEPEIHVDISAPSPGGSRSGMPRFMPLDDLVQENSNSALVRLAKGWKFITDDGDDVLELSDSLKITHKNISVRWKGAWIMCQALFLGLAILLISGIIASAGFSVGRCSDMDAHLQHKLKKQFSQALLNMEARHNHSVELLTGRAYDLETKLGCLKTFVLRPDDNEIYWVKLRQCLGIMPTQ